MTKGVFLINIWINPVVCWYCFLLFCTIFFPCNNNLTTTNEHAFSNKTFLPQWHQSSKSVCCWLIFDLIQLSIDIVCWCWSLFSVLRMSILACHAMGCREKWAKNNGLFHHGVPVGGWYCWKSAYQTVFGAKNHVPLLPAFAVFEQVSLFFYQISWEGQTQVSKICRAFRTAKYYNHYPLCVSTGVNFRCVFISLWSIIYKDISKCALTLTDIVPNTNAQKLDELDNLFLSQELV